jgi:hypothetical protein
MIPNHMSQRNGGLKRRSLLKSTGATASVGLFGVNLANAEASSKEQSFVGVSYDTLTHVAQGSCEGTVTRSSEGVQGTLEVGGFTISLGSSNLLGGSDPLEPDKLENGWPVYWFRSRRPEHVSDGRALKIKLKDRGDELVGYLTRSGNDYAKLGFTLGTVGAGATVEKIRGVLQNDGEGVSPLGYDDIPPVPDTGVPQNTSAAAHIEARRNGGDDT